MNKMIKGCFSLSPILALSLQVILSGCDASSGTANSLSQDPDPVTADFAIAYVERPIPLDEDGELVVDDIFDPTTFRPGASLVLKDSASASSAETNLTFGVFGLIEEGETAGSDALYDVKDLESSPDGSKLVFSMRAPDIEGVDDDDQPTWNIWEYDLETGDLERVITSNIIAEQGHDVAPHYLPDGRIVFSSNRQRRTRAILLDEQKPQYSGVDDKRRNEAFVLHVVDKDQQEVDQITFNGSHDLQPTVLDDGRILFLRWDAIGNRDQLSLYTVNPDGTNLQPYYGYHSPNTGTGNTEAAFAKPRQMLDGRIAVNLRPRETTRLGGDMVAIDAETFIDNDQPTYFNSGATGPAQESLTYADIDIRDRTDDDNPDAFDISLDGYFGTSYPMYDGTGRFLVSWSQCRLQIPAPEPAEGEEPEEGENVPCTDFYLNLEGIQPADPLYGLWIYDPLDGSQLPVKIPPEQHMITNAVVLSPRPQPAFYIPATPDPDLVNEKVGVVHIRSVHDLDGADSSENGITNMLDPVITPPDSRPERFLRLIKNVPYPDDDVLDFEEDLIGRVNYFREILGYVPIEPDGSAKFKVPSDVPFQIEIVNASGMRIGERHENWLQVRAGEERECKGCHTRNSRSPHARMDAEAPSVNDGAIEGVIFANNLLLDEFGTPQPLPIAGESMAEYYARINGPRTPSMDIIYTDEWTFSAVATPGADIQLRYIDFANTINANPRDGSCPPLDTAPATWYAPTSCLVTGSWTNMCRTTINYLESIHPLWEADRRSCDDLGVLETDYTCISCHTRGPADMLMVPAGQVELTGQQSVDENEFITSYVELLFQDTQQDVVDGSLVNLVIEIDTGEIERDANGDPILDADGNTIPIIQIQNVPAPPPALNTRGAFASRNFFNMFSAGGSHAGYLSEDELKLIAEWLDVGAQYYNNPFDIP